MILAGTLADVDFLSALFGPSAFLSWSGGPLHSIVGAIAIGFLVSLLIRTYAKSRGVILSGVLWWLAPICAALLHVAMDTLLSSGVTLLWPISTKRIALDWAPGFDLWILILLVIGIFLPELFRLVSDEIGAKSKKPRGQGGAVVTIVLIAAYFVLRGILHAGAAMTMLERSYAGESPRRVAAFADSMSPFLRIRAPYRPSPVGAARQFRSGNRGSHPQTGTVAHSGCRAEDRRCEKIFSNCAIPQGHRAARNRRIFRGVTRPEV